MCSLRPASPRGVPNYERRPAELRVDRLPRAVIRVRPQVAVGVERLRRGGVHYYASLFIRYVESVKTVQARLGPQLKQNPTRL